MASAVRPRSAHPGDAPPAPLRVVTPQPLITPASAIGRGDRAGCHHRRWSASGLAPNDRVPRPRGQPAPENPPRQEPHGGGHEERRDGPKPQPLPVHGPPPRPADGMPHVLVENPCILARLLPMAARRPRRGVGSALAPGPRLPSQAEGREESTLRRIHLMSIKKRGILLSIISQI